MRKWLSVVVAVTLAGALLMAVGAAGAASRNVIVKRGTAQVDAVLNDAIWKNAVWYDINEQTSFAENGKFANYSGSFAVAHDTDYVYFAYKANDSKLIGTRTGGNIWQDDCVEVWFNWKDARTEGEAGYYQVGLAPLSATGKPAAWVWRAAPGADSKALEGIKIASAPIDDGWILEASMGKSAFDVPKVPPINATFNVSVVNRDVEGSGGDTNWNHFTWNGTVHKDANQFVRMQFE